MARKKKCRTGASGSNRGTASNATILAPQHAPELLIEPTSPPESHASESEDGWSCKFCTFVNANADNACIMCEASRDGTTSFANQVMPPREEEEKEEEEEEEEWNEHGGDFSEHKPKVSKKQRVKTVWVGGLQNDWVEDDLAALFPTAVMTKMVYDQGAAGTYGFVEFSTREEAEQMLVHNKNKPIPGMEWRRYQLNWGTKNLDERWGGKKTQNGALYEAQEQPEDPSTDPCRFYLQGKCAYGAKCKNLHIEDPAPAPAPTPIPQRTVSPSIGFKPASSTQWKSAAETKGTIGPPTSAPAALAHSSENSGNLPQQPTSNTAFGALEAGEGFGYPLPSSQSRLFECFQPAGSDGLNGLYGASFASSAGLNLPANFYETQQPFDARGSATRFQSFADQSHQTELQTAEGADTEQLLRSLRLSRLEPLFAQEQIDIDALRLMSDQDFRELGIPKGPRMKLCRWITQNHDQCLA